MNFHTVLCLSAALAAAVPISAQQDFGVPFPDGEAPDGTKYKTAYRCEGEDLRISCDPGETIQVIRANYGRFSIAICNKNGYTDWSVNCMSHTTTRILQRKCDGESFCDIEVNSGVFGDPCPNTHKYVEVHYACSSQFGQLEGNGGTTTKKLPPWFLQGPAGSIWTSEADEAVNSEVSGPSLPSNSVRIPQKPAPRKPILVAAAQDPAKSTVETTVTTVKYQQRVPITTPKPSLKMSGESDETTTILSTTTEEEANFNELATTPHGQIEEFLDNHCAPALARNLKWNWTRSGDVAIQPCPNGSTGLARWPCDPVNLAFSGLQPDMSDCKSAAISDLESKVREEDPENVIVSSLERLTTSLSLYGGDLEAVVNILKAVLNRLQYLLQTKADSLYNKESFLQEIFQNVLRTGSNLLANQTLPAWMDLSRSRRIKVASNLIQTLDEHSLLLLSVLEKPEVILESTNEIAVALAVIDSSSSSLPMEKWTRFPTLVEHLGVASTKSPVTVNSNKAWGPKWIANLTDAIGISRTVIAAQAKPKLVFSSFANLHKLLADADQQLLESSPEMAKNRPMLNSRIISASFLRKPHNMESVASILFEHLRPTTGRSFCVFWDAQEENWSDSGCELVNSTESFSECACQHLTHFALLTLSDDFSLVGNGLDFVGLVQDKKEAQNNGNTNTVITLEIATYLVSSVCLLILLIILVQFRQQIKRGLQKTPCCKHRIKTASQRDDDVIDKTHHQVYASTVVHNNGHGIQLTLEQTLAPSSGLSGPSTSGSGSTSSTGTSGSDKVMNNNGIFLNNLRNPPHPPPSYVNHQINRLNHVPAASLPPSVRATPTADFELYPRHTRTNSYTQATQFYANNQVVQSTPIHRRNFNVNKQLTPPQQYQLKQLRSSDSCNSIAAISGHVAAGGVNKQLLYEKIHGRQSSSSAG